MKTVGYPLQLTYTDMVKRLQLTLGMGGFLLSVLINTADYMLLTMESLGRQRAGSSVLTELEEGDEIPANDEIDK